VDTTLNEEDVGRLLSHPDGETRAEIAAKIASQLPGLNPDQRRIAEDIFRVMVHDAEVRVRAALVRQLKDNPAVPHDVAIALANDVEDVSLPMLQFSEALTDEDLIEIVHSQGPEKQLAVAGRPTVSASVADALIDSGNEHAVATLISNDGADLTETSLGRVVERYGETETVGRSLIERKALPVSVAERLMTRVSEHLRTSLLARRDLSPETVAAVMIQARELAVLGLSSSEAEAAPLVDHLHHVGRLTPSIILRAICMGDIPFFEVALARLAGIKVENGRTLIHDAGKRGFEALFEKAGLPRPFFAAMRAAIDVSSEMEYDGRPHDRERFSRRMIERILTQYGDLGVDFENDDLEYLLAKLNRLPGTVTDQ